MGAFVGQVAVVAVLCFLIGSINPATLLARALGRDLRAAGSGHAAYAAGQAAAVGHVAAHELGAAAYAIRAVQADATPDERETARRRERDWQRDQLLREIRDLVLDDQRLRNELCWFVFGD